MNKELKKIIRLAFYETVEDHPAAFIMSSTIIGSLFVALILTVPILTILAAIIVFLIPPAILIVSFIRNYKELSFIRNYKKIK